MELECFIDQIAGSGVNSSVAKEEGGASIQSQSNAKLPKLRLDSFAGNPVHWHSFWDSFQSAVHNNSKLMNVDKFSCLRSLLEGPAAAAIAGLTLTNENYVKAIEMLKERFGNKQVTITGHMETLTRTPKVESSGNIKDLRSLYDQVESSIRGLESVGVKQEMYGCFLLPILMQKLPEDFRILITRDQSSETWELKDIMDSFNKELKLREQCTFTTRVLSKPADRQPQQAQRQGKSFSSSCALLSGSRQASSQNNKTVWCAFFRGQHQSTKCYIVTDPGARKQVLKDRGKCWLCLRSGHSVRNCTSGIQCFCCQSKEHHVSLCSGKDTSPISGQAGPSKRGNSNVPTTPEATSPKTQEGGTTLYVDQSRDSVFLQTAKACVFRPDDSSYSASIRLVFDSCSQRSYITKELKESLNLPVIGKDYLLIRTFGERDARLRVCDVVQIAMECLNGSLVYIKAFVVPTICGSLSQKPTSLAQTQYKHLQGLHLADSGDESLSIDMLVEADFYWTLVDGSIIREYPSEPVALSTKLGYVLSEPTPGFSSSSNTVNLTATYVLKIEATVVNSGPLSFELNKFWDYETLEIREQENSLYDNFVEDIKLFNGRYEVRLPFKEDHDLLPDNFSHSKSRLNSLLRKLRSQPDVLTQYDGVIQDQLSKGIIEPVTAESSPHQLARFTTFPIVRSSVLTKRQPNYVLYMMLVLVLRRIYRVSITACMQDTNVTPHLRHSAEISCLPNGVDC